MPSAVVGVPPDGETDGDPAVLGQLFPVVTEPGRAVTVFTP
ncbi:hypothetical protein [Streptomyces sp. LN549]